MSKAGSWGRAARRTVLGLTVFGFAMAFVHAQEDDANLIKYRQRLMSAHGAGMGNIGDILKFKLAYGTKHISQHALSIKRNSMLIEDAFKANKTGAPNDSKAGIWESWDDFAAKAKALTEAADELATAADGGDVMAVMPKVKALGEACRGCHNDYRKPKEESYKND